MQVVAPVRVFHCDDSSAFRVLVREMLSEFGGVEVVGEAASVEEARAALAGAAPDVVLVDVIDRGREAELIAGLRELVPQAEFIFYTGMPEHRVPSGEHHVHKSVPFEELHRVITEVAARA